MIDAFKGVGSPPLGRPVVPDEYRMQILLFSSSLGSVIFLQSRLCLKSQTNVPSALSSLISGWLSNTRIFRSDNPALFAESTANCFKSRLHTTNFPGPSRICLARSFTVLAGEAAE